MIRLILAIILIGVISASLFGLFASIFNGFFRGLDEQGAFIIISSFFGAFFAFLSIRIAQYLDAIYVRQKEHYNALVNFDLAINKSLSWAKDNIYLIDGLIELLKENEKGNIIVWKSYLKPYDFDDSQVTRLLNTDFANEVINRSVDIRKLNDSAASLNSWRDELTGLLFRDGDGRRFAQDHLSRVYDDFVEIGNYFEIYFENAKNTIASGRALAKEKTLLSYLFPLVARKHYGPGFEKKRARELAILEKEILEGANRKFDKVPHPKERETAGRGAEKQHEKV